MARVERPDAGERDYSVTSTRPYSATSGDVKDDIEDYEESEESERRLSSPPDDGRQCGFISDSDTCGEKADGGVPTGLPFAEYVAWAVELNAEEYRDRESGVTGRYLTPLWTFARLVKAYPGMAERKARDALRRVERVVAAMDGGGSGAFDAGPEDAQIEFLANWEKIRYVSGRTPLENAFARADDMPLEPPEDLTPTYGRFVSVAGWLQVAMGDRPIMLPCQLLAERLNCTPITVSRYRKLAIAQGLLRVVKLHRYRPQGRSGATRFRFDVTRYDCLEEAA